jgi:transcription elongation factor Elf1
MRSHHLSATGHALERCWQWPACPNCGELLLAAVSSALIDRGHIRHLWACDACGYSFPTAVRLQAAVEDDLA